jgi:hypothetical protein
MGSRLRENGKRNRFTIQAALTRHPRAVRRFAFTTALTSSYDDGSRKKGKI